MSKKQMQRWHENRVQRGEVVGGGYIVLRRGKAFGRISIDKGKLPYEHATEQSALLEAARLSALNPGVEFNVWHVVGMMKTLPVTEAQS